MLHSKVPPSQRHAPHTFEYANAAARTAATGFAEADVYKTALQLDDMSEWRLTSISPIAWKQVGCDGFLPKQDPSSSGTLTHNGGAVFAGGRPISLNPSTGVAQIKGDSGPWAIQYAFSGSAGANLGGFGGFGTANALSYYYIGPSYNAPVLRAYSSGNVSIGAAADAYRLYVANNAATSTVPASNVIARLQSNGAGADATLQFSDGVANAASISMTGGTLRLAPLGDTLHTSPSGGLGYGGGAGGTAIQPTSKSTPVTINKPSGVITTHPESLAAGASVQFRVDNNTVKRHDGIILTINNSAQGNNMRVKPWYAQNGFFWVDLKNEGGAAQALAVDIEFQILRGATE